LRAIIYDIIIKKNKGIYMKKNIGQFMTPSALAQVVANEVGMCDVVIDFAVGESSLLKAVQKKSNKKVQFIGFDVDKTMVERSNMALPQGRFRLADGLRARVPKVDNGIVSVVGNPPYLAATLDAQKWVEKAFEGFVGRQGTERAEVQFLARALVAARASGGQVIFIMPMGFADGDLYSRIRKALMEQYQLLRCIEIEAGVFDSTEARTMVLVINTKSTGLRETEICQLKAGEMIPRVVLKAVLEPGIRLDAKYHQARNSHLRVPQLKDLQVTIDRGGFSRKVAEELKIAAVHTSHLGKAKDQKLVARASSSSKHCKSYLTIQKGDILLSRTGKRVCWDPVLVSSGECPITDHVFRIRAPKSVHDLVYRSFWHPEFAPWLKATSKGVCATVLTKRELLQMPIFALSPSNQ
jgi:predicted RNA methylase